MQDELLQAQIGKLQENIINVIHVMYRGIEEELTHDQLAVGEYAVLTACLMNEPITVSDIQKHIALDTGRISRITSDLEDRNLVRKTRLRADRRVVWIAMTDEGRDVASRLVERIESFYTKITSRIADDELTQLIVFIEQMVANAERVRQKINEEAKRE